METELRFISLQVTFLSRRFHITFFSDLPFKTAALHSIFFVLSRYSSTIAVTVLLDKLSIRFWTTLSVTCLGKVWSSFTGPETYYILTIWCIYEYGLIINLFYLIIIFLFIAYISARQILTRFIPYTVSSYILVYLAGLFRTRDNFVYIQILFGVLHGFGTGTGKLHQQHTFSVLLYRLDLLQRSKSAMAW